MKADKKVSQRKNKGYIYKRLDFWGMPRYILTDWQKNFISESLDFNQLQKKLHRI